MATPAGGYISWTRSVRSTSPAVVGLEILTGEVRHAHAVSFCIAAVDRALRRDRVLVRERHNVTGRDVVRLGDDGRRQRQRTARRGQVGGGRVLRGKGRERLRQGGVARVRR